MGTGHQDYDYAAGSFPVIYKELTQADDALFPVKSDLATFNGPSVTAA
jgi:hypothetical protein